VNKQRNVRGTIKTVHGNSTWDVEVVGPTFYDALHCTDPDAFFNPGDPCVVVFTENSPWLPQILSQGRRKSGFTSSTPLEGLWLQGQGSPSLVPRSRSQQLVTFPDHAARLGTVAQSIAPAEEPSLGVVVGNFHDQALVVWMVGTELASGLYHNRLIALHLDTWVLAWHLDFGGHPTLASGSLDSAGHLFLEETSGLLFALGRGGLDSQLISVVDGSGNLISHLATTWDLSNSTVARRHVFRGWQTQRDYAGRPQSDTLMRDFKFNAERQLEVGFTFDLKTRFDLLSDPELASSGPEGGRWPVNPLTGHLLVWGSGWQVPDTTPEDALMSRGGQRTNETCGSTPYPQDPVTTTSGVVRDGPHRIEQATLAAINLETGLVEYGWTAFSFASDNLLDEISIANWDAYRLANPHGPESVGSLSHAPAASAFYTYVGFANDQSLDLGLASTAPIVTGNLHTVTSTCTNQEDSVEDNREEVAPWVVPAAGWHGAPCGIGEGVFHSSTSLFFPDYAQFGQGHQRLLPYGGARHPDERTKQGDDLILWGNADEFLRTDPVGGCIECDTEGNAYVAYMEQQGFVLGSATLAPTGPYQIVESSSEDFECLPGGGDGFTTVANELNRPGWFTYLIGELQFCCRTWLVKVDKTLGELHRLDISQRFDYKLKAENKAPGEGLLVSSLQRGTGDNVYILEPVLEAGVLLVMRDLRADIYPGSPTGCEHLPYRAIEVRNVSTLERVDIITMPEHLDEVTIDGNQERKWATCGWENSPGDFTSNPPVHKSGPAGGLPFVSFFFNVRLRKPDGSFEVKYRHWRIYWGDGLDVPPRSEIWDGFADDQPSDVQEARAMALAGAFGIWPISAHVSGDRWGLRAVRY
jgi:hypothetical protein